jgi:hypothetical protein
VGSAINNHISDQERLDRLRLIRSDNVGPRTFRALIKQTSGLLDHADGDQVSTSVLALLGPTPVAIDELIRSRAPPQRRSAWCSWNSKLPDGCARSAVAWWRWFERVPPSSGAHHRNTPIRCILVHSNYSFVNSRLARQCRLPAGP